MSKAGKRQLAQAETVQDSGQKHSQSVHGNSKSTSSPLGSWRPSMHRATGTLLLNPLQQQRGLQ